MRTRLLCMTAIIAMCVVGCDNNDNKSPQTPPPAGAGAGAGGGSGAGGAKLSIPLSEMAATARHDQNSCPINLTGSYIREVNEVDDEGDFISTETIDMYAEIENGVLMVSNGDPQDGSLKIPVTGRIESGVMDGQAYQALAVCENGTLTVAIEIPGYGKAAETYETRNDGQVLIASGEYMENGKVVVEPAREFTRQ